MYIPKPDGRQRPLAVAALEDKSVQRAVVALLNAICEEDFLGFSYGFRPGRGTHDALDALCVGIHSKKVSFILDADIQSFFDEVNHEWLIRFLEHRDQPASPPNRRGVPNAAVSRCSKYSIRFGNLARGHRTQPCRIRSMLYSTW